MPQQSPIDLGKAGPVSVQFPPGYLDLQWFGPLVGKPVRTDHGIEFVFENLDPRVGLRLGGKFFGLLKFHFHAPSEHKFNDREWPLEVHIVHGETADGPYGVLGVMVESGPGKPEVDSFFREITEYIVSEEKGEHVIPTDPRNFLPENRTDYFRYEGSLTTHLDKDNPETVSWAIYRDTLKVDPETLRRFIALGHASKRVQGLYRRFVLHNEG